MKSISLSVICFTVFTLLLVIATPSLKKRLYRSVFSPICFAVFLVPLYAVLYYLTPYDLYVFKPAFVEINVFVDFANGICLYLFLCVAFADLLIAAVTQPFSADILVMVYRAGRNGTDFEELSEAYSDGDGIDAVLEKRLNHLLEGAYIIKQDNYVTLTVKGRFIATISSILR